MKNELLDFMRSTFKSVWALETLLFLKRSRPRAWRRDELVAEIRSSDFVVSQSLDSLIAAGLVLVEAQDVVRYSPATVELELLTEQIEDLYRSKPDAVRRAIVFASEGDLQLFSDAFRLRKE